MAKKKSNKSSASTRRENLSLNQILLWGGATVVVIFVIVILVNVLGPSVSLAPVPQTTASPIVIEDYQELTSPHVQDDQSVQYNSDPPTSGPHNPQSYTTTFFDQAPNPRRMLHSLEHGYVIIYFDCTQLPADLTCDSLKAGIRKVMGDAGKYKILAAPITGQPTVITLASWTRIGRLDNFDIAQIKDYITQNRNKSPEPTAP
jgi:hypothetical protein